MFHFNVIWGLFFVFQENWSKKTKVIEKNLKKSELLPPPASLLFFTKANNEKSPLYRADSGKRKYACVTPSLPEKVHICCNALAVVNGFLIRGSNIRLAHGYSCGRPESRVLSFQRPQLCFETLPQFCFLSNK